MMYKAWSAEPQTAIVPMTLGTEKIVGVEELISRLYSKDTYNNSPHMRVKKWESNVPTYEEWVKNLKPRVYKSLQVISFQYIGKKNDIFDHNELSFPYMLKNGKWYIDTRYWIQRH